MSDNTVTVVGNIVDSPRRGRTANGHTVTNFRLAATQRYFDQAQGGYVDGNTLWIDVACWGELGGNVARSLAKGDPVIVRGVLHTESWESEAGRRSAARIKATQVGPNLARGYCDFRRPGRSQPDADAVPSEAGPARSEPSEPAPEWMDPEESRGERPENPRSGLDYEVDRETLDEAGFPELAPEPTPA